MYVRRLLAMGMAAVILWFSGMSGCAQGKASLVQVCAWEQYIDIYFSGNMGLDDLGGKISNQPMEIAGSGLLADGKASVRTTILVDTSMSMPSAVRGSVKLYIDTLIQNIGEKEQYRIVTFHEELNVLQEFTADRYDLAVAAEKIEFNGQKSRIYDAVYNTLPDRKPLGEEPCFYRTVIITDGIDDTESGVTKEELYLKLQADTYPVDVVEVSSEEKAEPDKEVSALMRISGGRYANLHEKSDLSELAAESAVEDVCWVRAVVPGALLDGSTRQVDLSDGEVSLQFDVKVPVYDVPAAEIQAPEEDSGGDVPVSTENPKADLTETPVPADAVLSAPADTAIPASAGTVLSDPADTGLPGLADAAGRDGYLPALAVGALLGTGVIGTGLIVWAVMRKRKGERREKRNESRRENGKGKNDTKGRGSGAENGARGGGGTVILSEGDASNAAFRVRLCPEDASGEEWDLPFGDGIMIGRDKSCPVRLADMTVAHFQCRLYLEDYVPMIENLSRSNITKVNEDLVSSPRQILEGDRIKCGLVTIVVEKLYASGSGGGKLNKDTHLINV